MTDRKPDALAPSSRPGALREAPTGDLVARGMEDLKALEQIVVFPDKHLEAAVRQALQKPDGPLTSGDLESLGELNAQPRGIRGISDLTGLERCVNLTYIWLYINRISDLTPLAALTKLTHLGGGKDREREDSMAEHVSACRNLGSPLPRPPARVRLPVAGVVSGSA